MIEVERHTDIIVADDNRVIPRYLDFSRPQRIQSIVKRVLALPETEVSDLLQQVQERFSSRHRNLEEVLRDNFKAVARHTRKAAKIADKHKLLIGAFFTLEYSIESAALFNPSIVPHPDQTGLAAGELRFLMSLRATGEGHVSSIVFRRGVIGADGRLRFDPPPRYAYSARPEYAHRDRTRKMKYLMSEIDQQQRPDLAKALADRLLWLAHADYQLHFPPDCHPSEIVIFPATRYERHGMEDLRLVRFVEDDGSERYFGTYTAYDGLAMHPMILETSDFLNFSVAPVAGRFARNKGMALLPRKIDGYYYLISRHDGENLFVLRSRDLYEWNTAHKLMAPEYPWELLQIGNCGSPLETRDGWLLITHGVGPLREYAIGVSLLDRDNPRRVLARLPYPLLTANESEREGYVPNVVYSCGAVIHNDTVIIPYAMSDSRTAFATVSLPALLEELAACSRT